MVPALLLPGLPVAPLPRRPVLPGEQEQFSALVRVMKKFVRIYIGKLSKLLSPTEPKSCYWSPVYPDHNNCPPDSQYPRGYVQAQAGRNVPEEDEREGG